MTPTTLNRLDRLNRPITRGQFTHPVPAGPSGTSGTSGENSGRVLVFGWWCSLCVLECPPRYMLGAAELLVDIHDRLQHNGHEVAYLTASEADPADVVWIGQ